MSTIERTKSQIIYTTDFQDEFSYNKKTRTISVEISSLELKDIPRMGLDWGQKICITSKKTNKSVNFRFHRTDLDVFKEVCGWRYVSDDNNFKLLIIND